MSIEPVSNNLSSLQEIIGITLMRKQLDNQTEMLDQILKLIPDPMIGQNADIKA
jgi:hypothetical protein